MRRIDELHLRYPFYGSRKITLALRSEGQDINRKHTQRLMRIMGLEALVPKPSTSCPSDEHRLYRKEKEPLLIFVIVKKSREKNKHALS